MAEEKIQEIPLGEEEKVEEKQQEKEEEKEEEKTEEKKEEKEEEKKEEKKEEKEEEKTEEKKEEKEEEKKEEKKEEKEEDEKTEEKKEEKEKEKEVNGTKKDEVDADFMKRYGVVNRVIDHKVDGEMVVLHGFRPILGMPVSASPFCAKLEVFLKWKKIDHQLRFDMASGPKGKYPFIQHRGRLVPDSEFILKYLKLALGLSDPVFEAATPERKAAARSVRRMLEEATMFTVLFQRWIDDEGWPTMKAELGKNINNFLINNFVLPVVLRPKIRSSCESQGTGRHSRELIYEMMEEDVDAIADLLGDRAYFFGDEMAFIDCTIYAFVANLLAPFPGVPNVPDFVKKHQNLIAYYDRITTEVFPDSVKK